MAEYDCESLVDALSTTSAVALERDEAELAQILAGSSQSDELNGGEIDTDCVLL